MTRSNRDGTWNVGTRRSTSILKLLGALEEKIEPAREIQHAPPRPGDVGNSRPPIAAIEKNLGWSPVFDLAGGIAGMVGKSPEPQNIVKASR